MKEQKVFIYCRILSNRARSLLNYQEDILTDFAKDMGMKIKAIAKDVSEGKYFDSQGMQKLIYYIVNEKIDIVLIYDKTRINIYDDLFMEFMMLCHKHKILVMTSDIFV